MKWYKDSYYNKETGENYYGLKHRKETVCVFLKACGVNPEIWYYKLPSKPKSNFRNKPTPEIVHKIINYNFFPDDSDKTKLYQYIHAHNFWLGPRAPSEMALLNLDDIKWDLEAINITEQKSISRLEPFIQKILSCLEKPVKALKTMSTK